MPIELGMFSLSALFCLMMGISLLGQVTSILRSSSADQEPGSTVTISNENEETSEGQQLESPSFRPTVEATVSQYASDPGYAGQIYAQLSAHPEAAYVLRNLALYPEEILQFIARFPEAMAYGAGYPDFIQTGIRQPIDLSGEVRQGSVPMLIQWDSRWGYSPYGESLVGYAGCGPTCVSMVSIALTGYHDNDPLSVATYAADNHYYTKGYGTAWSIMTEGCTHFGIEGKELPLDENKVISSVEEGHPVVLAMGPGEFTDNGHFIVVSGYSENGFTIRDPNSPAHSTRLWQWSELEDQIRNLWVFQAA